MASETIYFQVRSDYLNAVEWLRDSALKDWSHQWTYAALYLTGAALKRHQRILKRQLGVGVPHCIGVLRADHQVDVRHFSEDGTSCLVIDVQTHRRMATYDVASRERLHTQDLGSCAVVYRMVYDKEVRRWKIDSFIQTLPPGWSSHRLSPPLTLLTELPAPAGRDN
jgi:hypothetical protein